MIAQNNQNISFKDLSTTPKPKMPKYALGYAGITYIPGISDTIKRQLKQHSPDLKLAFRPASKVSQVFSEMKDKLEIGQNSNVVYMVRCKQCKGIYIGETCRCFYERCSQHKKDVENRGKKPTKTALVQHVVKTKHEYDFEKGQILKKVRSRGLLKIHEANQIIIHEDIAVNFKKDAQHISPVFYNLINKNKKLKKCRIVHPPGLQTFIRSEPPAQVSAQLNDKSD